MNLRGRGFLLLFFTIISHHLLFYSIILKVQLNIIKHIYGY